MNKLMTIVCGAVGFILILGIWYYIETYDRSDLPEWLGGDPKEYAIEDDGRLWNRFTPVEALAEAGFDRWPGTLECDPWQKWEGFTREKTLWVSDEMVAYDNGDVAAFIEAAGDGTAIPAEVSARFEWWRGEVIGTDVVMEGWYTAVNDRLKRLKMNGSLKEGELYLEGTRGPRDCRIEAARPE